MAWVLLLEKVDGMALAAMAAGVEEVDVFSARSHLVEAMAQPLERAVVPMSEERDLREALGLRT